MADLSELIKQVENKISSNTDIVKAMEEFFKDELDKIDKLHSIDLRSRLTAKAVRGHAVINFLESIKVEEANNLSLGIGLETLSMSLKRHVLSLEGKSRGEIIELFKARMEQLNPKINQMWGQMPK